MARWVKLTAIEKKRPVYVNIDNVTFMVSGNQGTEVWFAGHDRANLIVEEGPEAVVALRTI